MFKKILIISLLIFLVLLIVGVVYINNVFIPNNLKPFVIDMVQKSLGKQVRIDNASYFPLKGVVFSGIVITNMDNTPFLNVGKVDFGLKSLSRPKGQQFSAKVRLIVQEVAATQQKITIKGSSIVDIDVHLRDKQKLDFTGYVTLDNITVSGLSPAADIRGIMGEIICTQDSFSSEQLKALINGQVLNIAIEGAYDKDSVTVKNFKAEYGKTICSAQAKVVNFANPQLKLTATGVIDLKDIVKVLKNITLPSIAGEGNFSVKAEGLVTDLANITAEVKLESGQISVDKIKIASISAAAKLKEGIASLPLFQCDFYEGKVNATAKATITNPALPIECSLDAGNVNIKPLMQDIIGQDIGAGLINAHAGISGGALDLNSMTGSGWFKLVDAKVHMPANFENVAKALGIIELTQIEIYESSATFSIDDGKAETQDFIALSKQSVLNGKGYMDLEQYVDFEVIFKLSSEFVDQSGILSKLGSFSLGESGIPVARVKIYDKIPCKYKVLPPPVADVIKETVKEGFLNIIKGIGQTGEDSQGDSQDDLKEQIKEGLKGFLKQK